MRLKGAARFPSFCERCGSAKREAALLMHNSIGIERCGSAKREAALLMQKLITTETDFKG